MDSVSGALSALTQFQDFGLLALRLMDDPHQIRQSINLGRSECRQLTGSSATSG